MKRKGEKMINDDYINLHIRDELIQEVQELLDEDEIFDESLTTGEKLEQAIYYLIDNHHFYDCDEWGILYKWGNLEKLRESPCYQQACENCIEDVLEELR